METSGPLVVFVFILGASVGALLVTLQRECALDRIRREFEEKMADVLGRQSTSVDEPAGSRRSGRGFAKTDPGVGKATPETELGWPAVVRPSSSTADQTPLAY